MTEQSDETVDTCATCKGVQGLDHKHECSNCGADPGPGVLAVGDDSTPTNELFCDKFCIYEKHGPDHPLVAHISAERWEAEKVKKGIVKEIRLLRQRAAEAGVPWQL